MEWKRLILHGSLTRAHEKGSASLNIIFDFFSLTHNFHMYIMKYGSSETVGNCFSIFPLVYLFN